ncbi:GtrA family protein [Streptomyces qinglanensis]|uniref:Putative flippase GtrA (Transmembrane translocase of bactoprenol-linked glucose) n=1 Tax=Streptomyces qinglanensis TaxID=943816 RepID=A0A1H9VIW7_9ACTN|nr:GtrA family protein [Streptomyces qinglanensis]SES21509.1 Putative flippase GtrA (transmembrane translocase of bactoprenol-linked glucose) [Streptomyces qinglanensis]
MGEWRTMRPGLERLVRELGKFGAVGALGFLVNVAIFNLCIHTFQLAPIRSGVIAQVVAIGTNYLGNRYWTYRHTDKNRIHHETVLFFLFSGAGLVLENGILALSHYGLGYTSTLADNIAKNVIGLAVGTAFRFWAYRTWVFRARTKAPVRTRGIDGADAAGPPNGPAPDRRRPADGGAAGVGGGTAGVGEGVGTGAVLRDEAAGIRDEDAAGIRDEAAAGVRLTLGPAASAGAGRVEVGGLAAEEQREDRRQLLK